MKSEVKLEDIGALFENKEIEDAFMTAIPDWIESVFQNYTKHVVFQQLQQKIKDYSLSKSTLICEDIYKTCLDIILMFHESGHAVYQVKTTQGLNLELKEYLLIEMTQKTKNLRLFTMNLNLKTILKIVLL